MIEYMDLTFIIIYIYRYKIEDKYAQEVTNVTVLTIE